MSLNDGTPNIVITKGTTDGGGYSQTPPKTGPLEWDITIDPGKLPVVNLPGGKTRPASLVDVIAHEFGHVIGGMPKTQNGPPSDDIGNENWVIKNYENPIEVGLGETPRSQWTPTSWKKYKDSL
jgi:hypothetical protein